MVANDHSHKLLPDEVDAIVAMFACHGITLTLEISDSIQEVTVMPWGGNFFGNTAPGGFLDLKSIFSNHLFDDGWHYCIMGHQYALSGGTTTSSGLGERPGDDFVVTLGAFVNQTGTD